MSIKGKRFAHWNYRVLRWTDADESIYQIHEVHYASDGEITAWSEQPSFVDADSVDGLRQTLDKFRVAIELDVLDGDALPETVVIEP